MSCPEDLPKHPQRNNVFGNEQNKNAAACPQLSKNRDTDNTDSVTRCKDVKDQ